MYKHEEVEARVGQMSPPLRGLVEEMLRRGEQCVDHHIPPDEAFDSDVESQLRLAFSDPALRQEWIKFWQDYREACREDQRAIDRGGHDYEL